MNEISHHNTTQSLNKESSKAKKRDRLASEAKLLKAAEEIFSKQGFKGATTRMIAKKAGINESLIGRYFDGKMGLLVAIIENYIQNERGHEKLTYPPQASLVEELLGFARWKFDHDCKKNFDFFKIVLSQAIVDAKFNKKIRDLIPLFHQPELEARLTALQNQGKIRQDLEIQQIIKGLDIFMFGNMILQRILSGKSLDETEKTLEEFIKRHAQALEP